MYNKEKILFDLMLEKQAKLNDLTYPKWKEELTMVDWESAVLVEAGELLESYGYKWWKKQDKNLENVKVELIDILHFMLSHLHYFHKSVQEETRKIFINSFKNDDEDIKDDYSFKYFVLNLIVFGIKNTSYQFETLAKLFKYVGMDFEEVYKAYFTKNVLNKFRQKHGYKKRTYIKIWNYENRMVEDNVVAFLIAKDLSANKLFEKKLYNKLEKIYKQLPNVKGV